MPSVEEIFEALSEGRISFNEAVQLLMQAGFSGEIRSVPMIVRPQEQRVVIVKQGLRVGRDKIPSRKEMIEHNEKKADYCEVCKVCLADADKRLQMLVGKKLCSECVREVIEKLQNKGEEPTIREMNAKFVKRKKEETKNDQ